MPLMHCPHCGAENFTMVGWEDLDHCSSCRKPLADPVRGPLGEPGASASRTRHQGNKKGQNAKRPRRA